MYFDLAFFRGCSIHVRFGIAVFLNTVLAIAQVIYAHQAHSVTLLSDALHNLGDVIGLFIAWCAQILAQIQRHSPRYTYGYQKVTLLAAFINATLLLSSVGIIVYEVASKITHGSAINELQVLWIATLGIIVNGLTALLFIREKESNLNVRAAFLHLTLDALTSIGVVLSALIIYFGGYQWLDSLTALLIATLISISGWKLLRRSIDLLLAAVPHDISLDAVMQYLENIPEVTAVKKVHIWALGNEKVALTAHLIRSNNPNPIDYSTIQENLAQQFKITEVTLQTMEGESFMPRGKKKPLHI